MTALLPAKDAREAAAGPLPLPESRDAGPAGEAGGGPEAGPGGAREDQHLRLLLPGDTATLVTCPRGATLTCPNTATLVSQT